MSTGQRRPNRLDPVGCACTDCLTGWSRPVDQYQPDEVTFALMDADLIDDATGIDWSELHRRKRDAANRAQREFYAELRQTARP